MKAKNYFSGRGQPSPGTELPDVDYYEHQKGEGYRASSALAGAVNVALALRMPLLLTGEPGSGKSRLAEAVAWELGLRGPWKFVVKSDTRGTDIFYDFDTVGRFHAAQTSEGNVEPRRFITFNALGKAILYARQKSYLTHKLGLPLSLDVVRDHPGEPDRPSVVLIDEIDKAPRDVPNDILTEIEGMEFRIRELEASEGGEVRVSLNKQDAVHEKGANRLRPVVIITSNSEKALPDAFMRRCVYFHLEPSPFKDDIKQDADNDDEITVEEIIASRLGTRFVDAPNTLGADAVAFYRYLRQSDGIQLERRPSLAEFLNWLQIILPEEGGSTSTRLTELPHKLLLDSIRGTLLKDPSVQGKADEILANWPKYRSK